MQAFTITIDKGDNGGTAGSQTAGVSTVHFSLLFDRRRVGKNVSFGIGTGTLGVYHAGHILIPDDSGRLHGDAIDRLRDRPADVGDIHSVCHECD